MTGDVLPAVLDPARLAALDATGLLDGAAEPAFDRLTRLATRLLNAPMALVSLVDGKRQFFKSAVGLCEPWATRRETPLTHSFCKHVVADRAPFVVTNAFEHPVLAENLAVSELGVVAYAGVPLITADEQNLGAFCVLDDKVHEWTPEDVETLRELAASVLTEIELRSRVREAERAKAAFRAVTDSAHDGIIGTDATGTIVFWNRAASRLLGHRAEEALGRPLTLVLPERLHADYLANKDRYLGQTAEVLHLRRDGTEIPLELSLSTSTSERGPLFTAILRDPTERNRQALQLQRMQEQLGLTIDNAPIGMAIVSVDGRFLRVNKALCEIVGYPPEELVKKTFQQITHPDDLEADLELLSKLLYGEISRYKLAKRYIHADGRLVDIMLHVSIVRGVHGDPSHFIAQIEDVTAIRQAQRALAEKTSILESVLEQMNEGVMVVDAGSNVVMKNPAASRILGPGPIDYDASNAAYLLSPDGKRPFRWEELAHVRALRGDHVDQVEVFYRGKPSRPGRWHSVTAAPLRRANDGPVWGAVVVGRDITNMKEQTATIRLLQEVATAANQATSVHEALQQVLRLVCEFTGRIVGHVYFAQGNELVPSSIWDVRGRDFSVFQELTGRAQLVKGLDLPGRVLQTGRPVHTEDAQSDPTFLRARGGVELGIHGGFAFPALVGDEVVAVFECYSDRPEKANPHLLRVLTHVGEQIGRVAERERHAEMVRNLSLTDELTGLYNRRGFSTLVEPQLRAALRQKKPAILLFTDMDGLKRINDELGHDAGDEAIRAMAAVLRGTFRDSDIVARLGGDEFVAYLPDAADPLTPERRLQEALSLENLRNERSFVLAASVGTVPFDPAAPQDLDALLQRADASMYDQKRRRKALRDSTRPRARLG